MSRPGPDGAPRVSVLMTTYRTPPALLRKAVDSILRQSLSDLELILVFEPDDQDRETLRAEIMDPRLVVVTNQKKLGMTGSLNAALGKARARLVARMDSDDVAHPRRLESQVAFLDDHPGVTLLGTSMRLVDAEGQEIGMRRAAETHLQIVRRFALTNAMFHPTVMWDRQMAGPGIRYDPRFQSAEDLELWLRLLEGGHRIANLGGVHLDYRMAGAAKRPRDNWRNNARVRILHWRLALRHPAFALGLAAYCLLAVMPQSVVDLLTTRSHFSDRVRAIRKSGKMPY